MNRAPVLALLLTLLLCGCPSQSTVTVPPASSLRPGGEAVTFDENPAQQEILAFVPAEVDPTETVLVPVGTRVKVLSVESDRTRVSIREGRYQGVAARIGRHWLKPIP